ncbi:MAG: DUF2892 domain-containing protein [Epsilonproteobacteria bacterium]|nr:DUF2892 domain-containing protein [Campylobacterota bacterium]
MKVDESAADEIVKIILGIILLPLIFVGFKISRGRIGLIPLIIDAAGICPLYAVFGIETCKTNKQA